MLTFRICLSALALLPVFTGIGTAQSAGAAAVAESTTVAAGARYRAGWLRRLMLGNHYRDLWATPVRVEVLDLDAFAGGLRPLQRGGGQQTKSLRFRGADEREYTFRSVDKDPSVLLPAELRGTGLGGVLQDQISAGHPAAPFVVAPLLEAAGVLHAEPRLVVLREGDSRLGTFEPEFGGMLGILEERAEVGKGPGFGGATEVIGTDKLLQRLERDGDHLVDAPQFLRARMVDIFLGDWDRHQDQWRWARFGKDKPARWVAIPRDRDQAFARYDGLLLSVARGTAPQLVKFGPRYPGMLGLTWNGRDLDRRFLVGLERPVWDSVATELRARLTDEVIESAVSRLPAAYLPLDSTRLATALKQRRDRLPEAAARFYRHLAREVDVHTSDLDEAVVVQRVDERVTEVTVLPGLFHRRFDRGETDDIRLYLHGGDDSVIVRGGGEGPRLRIIGGGGDDRVADSSSGGRVNFYATDPGDLVLGGRDVAVGRKRYRPADPAQRDWGQRWLSQAWFSSGPDVGFLLGTGVTLTRYGFRQDPFAQRYRLRAGYATGASTVGAELTGEWHWPNSTRRAGLLIRGTGIDVLRFHGFGNENSSEGASEFYRVNQASFTVAPSLTLPLAPRVELSFSPLLKYSSTDLDQTRFVGITRPYGSGRFGMLGGGAGLEFDSRNRRIAATSGARLALGGSYYPGLWDVEEDFGELHGEISTYLTGDSLPLQPTLALRAGGKQVWGRYPYQESAFLGGNSTVRLGHENRYAGDAALYGGAELRLFLTRFFLLLPGDFGIFGLGDVGRVYLEGESSDRWHAAAGGGVWFAFVERANTVSLAVTKGSERTAVYLRIGFGF
ncbi:MAG: hypothetical protein H0T90_04185 [Gemmatimonadales bacterium]|nr:hypothetical protein [Gemmatimonadales bacterium]